MCVDVKSDGTATFLCLSHSIMYCGIAVFLVYSSAMSEHRYRERFKTGILRISEVSCNRPSFMHRNLHGKALIIRVFGLHFGYRWLHTLLSHLAYLFFPEFCKIGRSFIPGLQILWCHYYTDR